MWGGGRDVRSAELSEHRQYRSVAWLIFVEGWDQLGLLRFFVFAWLIFVESDAISFMNSEG